MASPIKGIPVSPLTGVLDTRSAPDAMAQGALRMRQNLQTVAQNKLRRGSGWEKLLSQDSYNNSDFHDQLLALSGGIRQPITLAFEAESSRGTRSLFIATQGTIAQLNEYSGNYRIIGSGYGGDVTTSGKARRFKSAQLGDYIAFTNDFEAPMYHVVDQNPEDSPLLMNRFTDFDLIGLTRARVTWSWRNCLFFADVEMDGERFASRLLWSNFKDPTSFDPAKLSSITGSKDLFTNERILAGMPGLGNTFVIYTTMGMWEMSVVGGDQSYAFRRIYNGEENPGIALLKYPNTLASIETGHIYMAEDGIYGFNQYSNRPERYEWLHRSSSVLYDNIDKTACDTHIAQVCNDELLISVARVGAPNACPDITLRVKMTEKVADVVDHGFTVLCAYKSYRVPTIRDFIIENGICTLSALNAAGFGFTNEGLPSPLPSSTAAFTPNEFYSATPKVVGNGDDAGTPETVVEVSRTSNVATVKVVAHGFLSTNRVIIAGIADPSFNAANATITKIDADHFTYPNKGPNVSTTPAAAPAVRVIGRPAEAVAIVLADGTVTVKMKAHGFSNGQLLRIAGKFTGNPLLNTILVAITVLDVDTFTYASSAVVADTQFGAANIVNTIADQAVYDWKTDGTPHYTNADAMIVGLIYFYVPGDNETKLHLVGPNTDLTSTDHFVYDGAGIELIGDDGADFTFDYAYDISTSAPPSAGTLRFNNVDPTAAGHIYVQRLDGNGDDQSQMLRDVQVGDSLRVSQVADPTIFHVVKVTGTVKHNNYFDYSITYAAGNGTLADTDPVHFSSIPTSTPSKFITAKIFTGLKVMVSTVGTVLTPTTVARNDLDNPDVVTMALTAHGLTNNEYIWVYGMSDQSFNAFAAKVVVIENLEHPELSATDANHFTYLRKGAETDTEPVSSPSASLLTATDAVTEDYTQAMADADSLCALLGNERLDDICRQCDGSTIFVAASSVDWCLKQLGGVFYREQCSNTSAVGSTTANGYQSSVGSYVMEGYDSIFRFAPMFTSAPGQPYIECGELKVFYQEVAQIPPSNIGLRVGISGQPKDPNVEGCGIIWFQHSLKPIKCLTSMTEAQHAKANTQPDQYALWKFYRKGRYVSIELTISGVGGDAVFTGVVADACQEGAANH